MPFLFKNLWRNRRITDKKVLSIKSIDNDQFDRSKRLGWFDIKTVSDAKVLVVGAGALGNEVCKNLVLSGFRNISIVDMDYVVRSNLNRCIFFSVEDAERKNMKATVLKKKLMILNPSVNVKSFIDPIENLSDEFIPSFNLVLGCLDNILARLHVNAHCYYNQIPFIDGGTNGLIGKVQVVIPPKTSCFECGLNRTHSKIEAMKLSCTDREVSFFESIIASDINTTSLIAAVQVQEALKIIHKRWGQVIYNLFYYDGNRNIAEILEIPINPHCYHHNHSNI